MTNQCKSLALSEDVEGKIKLKEIIGFCFDSQRVYGKEPEQIGNVNKMFQLILAEYPYEKIRAAFIRFLKTSPEMPTPADICRLIDGEGKPVFDKSTYIALQKRKDADDYLTPKERKYMQEYENQNIEGHRLDR